MVFTEMLLTIYDMHFMSFERRANLIVGCFMASNDLLVCFPLPRDGRLHVWVSPDVQKAQKRRLRMQTPNGVLFDCREYDDESTSDSITNLTW